MLLSIALIAINFWRSILFQQQIVLSYSENKFDSLCKKGNFSNDYFIFYQLNDSTFPAKTMFNLAERN